MAFVKGGLGSGFGGLDQDVESPRDTSKLKRTSVMGKRNNRGSSNKNTYNSKTPVKDKTMELLNKHLYAPDSLEYEELRRQNTMMSMTGPTKRERSKLRTKIVEDVRNSVSKKHKVQPGYKISPRHIKLYHQAIDNPYHKNEFEKSVFNHYNPSETSK